jgi:hypothetical protein
MSIKEDVSKCNQREKLCQLHWKQCALRHEQKLRALAKLHCIQPWLQCTTPINQSPPTWDVVECNCQGHDGSKGGVG